MSKYNIVITLYLQLTYIGTEYKKEKKNKTITNKMKKLP